MSSHSHETIAMPGGTALILRTFINAPVEYRRIAPPEVGAKRIGHFGFFRPQFERTLWPLVPQWLTEQTR